MSKKRKYSYDIVYGPNDEIGIEEHFCRDYECNPNDHGMSWKQARKEVVKFYKSLSKRKIKEWKNKTSKEYFNF